MTYMAMSYRHLRAYFAAILIGSVGMLSVPQAHATPFKITLADYAARFRGDGFYSHRVRIDRRQMLRLPNRRVWHYVIHLEMEHAIGVAHEQNRLDRDYYVDLAME